MDFLQTLLQCPTAPFREHLVRNLIELELSKHQIPYFRDQSGNVVAGVSDPHQYRFWLQQPQPKLFGIAHMDHPGFFGKHWVGATCEVDWHGGGPVQNLETDVWISLPDGTVGKGKVEKVDCLPISRFPRKLWVHVQDSQFHGHEIFGGFPGTTAVHRENGLIYTKAADDLIGCFILLECLKLQNRIQPTTVVLFSRAEEVGFVGCIAHLQEFGEAIRNSNTTALSLETSRFLPNAEIGKGVIVRLGDRMNTFDSFKTAIVKSIANQVLPGQHQSRIMDGGACEASACIAFGVPAIGLSIPLGNYHNTTPAGDPAPEFIHESDLQCALTLTKSIQSFVANRPKDWLEPFHENAEKISSRFEKLKDLLLETGN